MSNLCSASEIQSAEKEIYGAAVVTVSWLFGLPYRKTAWLSVMFM